MTPPPGWPVAQRPRRIAFLGWARLSAQAREGSGYNLAASELASGLSLMGHEVFYLRSGMDYSFRPGMFIREAPPWRGIRCFHLFNSPNLAPALFNFRNMRREMSSPEHTSRVVRWLEELEIELVHAHSLEGYGLDLARAIRQSGRPVVNTTHNYWYACPQVDLLYQETHVCTDYRGGARCVDCLEPSTPGRIRLRRRIEQGATRLFGPAVGNLVRNHFFAPLRKGAGHARAFRAGGDEMSESDPELALGFDIDASDEHDGRVHNPTPLESADEVRELGRSPLDQNERFLKAGCHLKVVNDYGRRRHAGVAALCDGSMVTPPSRFMCEVYQSMGVPPEKLHLLRLGLSHLDRINRRARRSPFYAQRPWDPRTSRRPLRLAFFGTVRHNKGLDVLVRAIPMLEPRIRQRCQFLIRAAGQDAVHRRRLGEYPEVSFLGGYDVRELVGAWGEYDVGVLTHVWFENSPIVLLEFLHAGKFVVASRLGGPPEWVAEPGTPGSEANGGLGNGLLFAGGQPEALARSITRLVTGEVAIPSPREVHSVSPLVSYPDHVREAEALYRRLLGEPETPQRPQPRSAGERHAVGS